MLNRTEQIEKCPSYLNCGAPICPLDPIIKGCCWYPDDDVCKRNFPPQWVKTQRRISIKTRSMDTYYTFKMLSQNCVVGKGIIGIFPDRPEEEQIKSWLKRHPTKRILTEEEREKLRERFKRNIQITK